MAYMNFSSISSQALEVWERDLNHVVLRSQPLLEKIQRQNVFNPQIGKFYDNKLIIDTQYGYGASSRYVAPEGYLPSSTVPTYVKMTAELATIKDRRHIDWEVYHSAAGRGDGAWFIDAGTNLMESMVISCKHRLEAALMGFKVNGALAAIVSGANSATQTCQWNANNYVGYPGTKFLATGMPVVIANAVDLAGSSYGTGSDVNNTVSKIVSDTSVVFANSIDTTSGGPYYICPGEYSNSTRQCDYGKATPGLWQHVDDGTDSATYQGITRSDYPVLWANKISSGTPGTVAALTEAMIDQALDAAAEYMSIEEITPDIILCTRKMRRTIKALTATTNPSRWLDFKEAPDFGSIESRPRIQGKTLLTSKYAHPGRIYFLKSDSFVFYTSHTSNDPDRFFEWDTANMFQRKGTLGDKDILELLVRCRHAFVCLRPRENTLLNDLVETS